MYQFRQFLSASVLFSLLMSVIAGPVDSRPHDENAAADLEEFERLLDQVDPPSLHAALHDYSPKKFKHGMFQQDRTAIEVIHRDNAPLATTIVSIAKRQSPDVSNSTATSAPTTTTQGPGPVVTPVPQGPVTSSSSGSDISPSTPTTNGGSSSPGSPSSVTSAPAGSSSSGAPTSASKGPTSAPASLAAGAVLTTTNAAGATVLSTLSAGSVVTTVNAAGVTVVSTVGGGSHTLSSSASPSPSSGASTSRAAPSSQTSLVVQTTTLPDGQKSTVTSVAMITAGVSGATPSGTAGVSSSGTASSSPGLQTAMATRTGAMKMEMLCMVGGAVGMALLM